MLDKIKNYAKHYENEVRDISNQLRYEMMPELSRELFDENLVTRYPVTVHTGQDHKNKVVIHGERHKLVIEFGEAAGAVLVTKEPHVNHEAQDELVNRISWEVLHNEQNADCKMYFYLEKPDK